MVALVGNALGAPLRESYKTGFTYADCWVDDSRLVVLNALDARERGAAIHVGAKLASAARKGDRWIARIDGEHGASEVEARVLVNAAGPWVSRVIDDALHLRSRKHARLVKGSHLVTRKLFDGDHAYILQNPDKRIVFAIPYEADFTLVGTTDVPYDDAPGKVEISDAETDYLLASINRCLRREVGRDDIVWSYAGLRPLYDDGSLDASVVTRDYAFDLDATEDRRRRCRFSAARSPRRAVSPNMRSTNCRRFSPNMAAPGPRPPRCPAATCATRISRRFSPSLMRTNPFLAPALARRLARAYGTRVWRILKDARGMSDLGADHGCGLTDAEIAYLVEQEWARSLDDILGAAPSSGCI